jgi:integration host factor subunit alpha|tara:strand:- start:510 stop:782 length:273 start_codon:yes stop_codon:yes gene_type:complete
VSLTKKDLARQISKKLRLSQKDSLFFVTNFFKMITENLENGVSIKNFGNFSLKKTPKRIGRNPKTLQEFVIKARQKLSYTPSEEVKRNLN